MEWMRPQHAPKEYVSVCSICGCPLKKDEIHASFVGEAWYNPMPKEKFVPAALHFCEECFLKVQTFANNSVDKAWRRYRQLDGM